MEKNQKTVIRVETIIHAPIKKVWECWTGPSHITQWNQASNDWHTPRAENDLRKGGKFLSRMEAKDGSAGFDFWGIYDEVRNNDYIESTLGDGRKWKVSFQDQGIATRVIEDFEAESTHPIEMQKAGWQAILDHFKKYTEDHT